jgi:hypothetical protein
VLIKKLKRQTRLVALTDQFTGNVPFDSLHPLVADQNAFANRLPSGKVGTTGGGSLKSQQSTIPENCRHMDGSSLGTKNRSSTDHARLLVQPTANRNLVVYSSNDLNGEHVFNVRSWSSIAAVHLWQLSGGSIFEY